MGIVVSELVIKRPRYTMVIARGTQGLPGADASQYPAYQSDADAIADGLSAGDPYWALPGHEAVPANTLTRVAS